MVTAAECLLDLCSSSSASKVKTLISIIRKKKFELNATREHLSSVADCRKVTNAVWKLHLLRAEFESEEINADKNMLNKKNPVKFLQRSLKSSSIRSTLKR